MNEQAFYDFLTEADRKDMVRVLAKAGGRRSQFFYELFDELNRQFFDNALPTPLILSEITPYGACLGDTKTGGELRIPHIRIHPAMCDRQGKVNPEAWKGGFQGNIYTLMIHEMTHTAQKLPHLIELTGETAHNATNWVSECNRMSEAWELPKCCRRWKVQREGKKTARMPDRNEPTATVFLDDLTMDRVSRWPHAVAELVHDDPKGWIDSCVKRLNLPTF